MRQWKNVHNCVWVKVEVVAFCTAQKRFQKYALIESITNSFGLNLIMNVADESTLADDDDGGSEWLEWLKCKTLKFNLIFHLCTRKISSI